MLSTFTRGEKIFELSNHLGNVLATITDKKIQKEIGYKITPGPIFGSILMTTEVEWPYAGPDPQDVEGPFLVYKADVATANDYYPFGMQMPGRKYSAAGAYRYGFNGKENDNEVKGEGNEQDYGMRIYDPRLGRFLSVDPLTKSYPHYTPYSFAGNKPIQCVDLDGKEEFPAFLKTELEVHAFLSNLIGKTLVVSANLQNQMGVGAASQNIKGAYSIAVDPQGNIGFATTYAGFFDLFHTFGGAAEDFTKTGNEKGSDGGSFYLGSSVGLSSNFGVYDFDHIERLSGEFYDADASFSFFGGSLASSDGENVVGGSFGIGIGPMDVTAGIGGGKTNTKLIGVQMDDINQYNDAISNAKKATAKYEGEGKFNKIKTEWNNVINAGNKTVHLFLNVVGEDLNGTKTTLESFDAIEFIEKSDNYTRTSRVSATEPKPTNSNP